VADIFISFAHADQDRVRPIAERLASLGYSAVWENCDAEAAERELASARAVLTAWSSEARNSIRICAEASRALDEGKLIQLRLDGAQPPAPFDALPATDVSSDRAEWGPLEAALATLIRDGAGDAPAFPRTGLLATPAAAGAPKLLTIALVTSLAAFVGALDAAQSGVMTPDQLQLALTGIVGVAGASAALCLHRLFTIARAES